MSALPQSNRLPGTEPGMPNQGNKLDALRCQLARSSTMRGTERQSISGSVCHEKPSSIAVAPGNKSSSCGSLSEIFGKVTACRRGGCSWSQKAWVRRCYLFKTHRNGTRVAHVTAAAPCHTRTADQPNSLMIFAGWRSRKSQPWRILCAVSASARS
jgi:hypothetical protein